MELIFCIIIALIGFVLLGMARTRVETFLAIAILIAGFYLSTQIDMTTHISVSFNTSEYTIDTISFDSTGKPKEFRILDKEIKERLL